MHFKSFLSRIRIGLRSRCQCVVRQFRMWLRAPVAGLNQSSAGLSKQANILDQQQGLHFCTAFADQPLPPNTLDLFGAGLRNGNTVHTGKC